MHPELTHQHSVPTQTILFGRKNRFASFFVFFFISIRKQKVILKRWKICQIEIVNSHQWNHWSVSNHFFYFPFNIFFCTCLAVTLSLLPMKDLEYRNLMRIFFSILISFFLVRMIDPLSFGTSFERKRHTHKNAHSHSRSLTVNSAILFISQFSSVVVIFGRFCHLCHTLTLYLYCTSWRNYKNFFVRWWGLYFVIFPSNSYTTGLRMKILLWCWQLCARA